MDRLNYIIDLIDANLKTHYNKDTTYYGLCTQEYKGKERMPMYYKGNGNFDFVGFNDNSSLSIYHRLNSFSESDDQNGGFGLSMLKDEVYTMELIAFGDQKKINNGATLDISLRIADEMKGKILSSLTSDQLSTINCMSCLIRSTGINRNKFDVFKAEFPDTESNKIKPQHLLFSVTYSISLKFLQSCKDDSCGDVTPVSTPSYVTIIDQSGNVIDYVTAGNTYQVVQWAGLDEGGATTTYTDGITDQ